MKKTVITSSVALILGAPAANAALVTDIFGANTWSTDSANFTMLKGNGGTFDGTNDVVMNWDGNGYSASSDYTGPGSAANVTASSTTPYFGVNWTAHDIQIFTPGTYSFDTTLGGGSAETDILNVTVPAGGIGMHMLFDWSGNLNIDIFVVMAPNSVFGAGIGRSQGGVTSSSGAFLCDFGSTTTASGAVGISNCLYDGPGFGSDGRPAGNKIWTLATVDGDGDGIMGIPMAAMGPFPGFNATFSANLTATPKTSTVPVPTAVWLFGSGLLGLGGLARRRITADPA